MTAKAQQYVVQYCPDGGVEEYVGDASTLAAARKLVRRHERGEISGTPRSMWDTARAANSYADGCCIPTPVEYDEEEQRDADPVEWAGRDECYAICRAAA